MQDKQIFKARQAHNGALQTAFRLPLLEIYASTCLGTSCVFCTCTAIGYSDLYSARFPCVPCMLYHDACNYTGLLKGKFDIFNMPFEFNPSGDFPVIGCLFIILGPCFKNYDCYALAFQYFI